MADVESMAARVAKYVPAGKDGQPGRDGLDGKDGVDGQPGRDGLDGKDGPAGPAGKDGADGKDGQPGRDGLDGKDGVDGQPGRDGLDGKDGKDGPAGRDGLDGKDAAPVSEAAIADSVAARFERRFADLSLSWERQARDAISKAIDRLPVPRDGRDGKDALPIDALSIQHDGERSLTIKLGDQQHTVHVPAIIYREVWREGRYTKGDAVTYGSSLWIARADTDEAPGTGKDWQLAVKKGRDGKDLRDSASTHDAGRGVSL